MKEELKRIGKNIVREYPDFHRAVKALPGDTAGFQERDPVARMLSLVLGDIVIACLMAAAAYV